MTRLRLVPAVLAGLALRLTGRRVGVVVNYDGFRLDESVADDYAAMVRELADAHYTDVSRYTTSAFLRHKLSNVLTRVVAPHIFETQAEARAFHERAKERDEG